LTDKAKLLWVGDESVPANVRQASRDRWRLTHCRNGEALAEQIDAADLAIISLNGEADDRGRLTRLLEDMSLCSAPTILMIPAEARDAWTFLAGWPDAPLCLPRDLPVEQLQARLAALAELRPVISRLRSELAAARSLHDTATTTVQSLNEEMRLAARLQRDFLPRRLPEVGPARFGVLFKPTSWVSGDIYDVVRLDETHVGFYVADVVGHGMPAALLTMFIKKALQTKRIVGHSYEIIPPHVSLAELNLDMCEQRMSSCQFCTAVYGVLDVATMTLTYARAGHPEPLVFRGDQPVERLEAPGSLMGIFPDESYHSRRFSLRPGDRLLLYTDGIEDAFRSPGGDRHVNLEKVLAPLAALPRDEMLLQLTARIDAKYTCDPPEDDITVLVVDIEP